MPKRRYYYDRKGNLTGSSSDTYLATPKGWAGFIVILGLMGIFGYGHSGESSKESESLIADGDESEPEQRIVIASSLSVRNGDRIDATKIGALPYGTKAKILYDSGDWAQIEYNGGTGWVFDKYLRNSDPEVVASSPNSKYLERPPSKAVPSTSKLSQDARAELEAHASSPSDADRLIEVPTDGRPVRYGRSRSTEAYMQRMYVGGNSNCPREMVTYQIQECRAGDEQQCRLLQKTCGASIQKEISATAASK
jgi:hypothetical protein